jgi:hypothetical protein
VNSANAPKVIRIRPTTASIREPMNDPHYVPKDPRNTVQVATHRRFACRVFCFCCTIPQLGSTTCRR